MSQTLMEAASAPDNELHVLATLGVARGRFEIPEFREAWSIITEARGLYDRELDRFAVDLLRNRRRFPDDDRSLILSSGTDEFDDAKQKFIRAWERVHAPTETFVATVQQTLAASIGGQEATQWCHRYLRELCPELMRDRWVEGMVEWFALLPDVEDEQINDVQGCYRDYLIERDRLRDRAVSAGLALKRVQIFPVAGETDQQLHYARRLLTLHLLARRTVRRASVSLTPSQRTLLGSALAEIDGTPRIDLLGPPIDRQSLIQIEAVERFYGPLF